jgi:formylglycine-generating enzyme required for sulfatase activity/tRNA A-37 threonylcarbamoyl transferase component Bud32
MPDPIAEFADRWLPDPEARAALRALVRGLALPAPVSLTSLGSDAPQPVLLDRPGSEPTLLQGGSDTFASEAGDTLAAEPEPVPVAVDLGRYEDLGVIGRGGMGEVLRVREPALHRVVAMKVIRRDLAGNPAVVARFVEEAQCTAQLQHPGIVPVHELGRLPDGRLYFTMREVHGRTLREVIREVHKASPFEWQATESGWSFRRLVDAFHAACEAVAYAHARGVVHRDLKPENVMVGGFGEVLVMDWGLARIPGRELDSKIGNVAGTPSYMAPEQARGEVDRIDARTDVYALGAVLWHLLTGKPPYMGARSRDVVEQVIAGPPRTPGRRNGPPVPDELVAVCSKAMDREPEGRHADAGALARDVAAWLDGARKREQALAVVERATSLVEASSRLRRESRLRGERAAALLEGVRPTDAEELKHPGWAEQDAARALEIDADLKDLQAAQALRSALEIAPDLPEAHAALAHRARVEHERAEERRDDAAAARAEVTLRLHAGALPEAHPTRIASFAWLQGDGALTLVTDPPAEVELLRYEIQHRRLVAAPFRSLGRTPLRAVALPRGSYLAILRAEGCAEVRYPVAIGRQEHWDGVPPGESEPFPIRLPLRAELGADEIYVPAGWCTVGGDPLAQDPLPRRRVWVGAFALRRFPTINREWIAWLDRLVAEGNEPEALAWVPRERGRSFGSDGAMIYGRDAEGRFVLVPDHDGDAWLPDYPVVMLDRASALAWGRAESLRTGQPWRLPSEIEREKAARGVDGRFFPWGDFLDPTWTSMRHSHGTRATPAVVSAFPVDESPYGCRHLGGNSRDWCLESYDEGPRIEGERLVLVEPAVDRRSVIRGGMWFGLEPICRAASRYGITPTARSGDLGVRLARSL